MKKVLKFLGCEMKFETFGFRKKKKQPVRELYDLGDIIVKGNSLFHFDAGTNVGLKMKLDQFVNNEGVFEGGHVLIKDYKQTNFDITQSNCPHIYKGINPYVIAFVIGNRESFMRVVVCADCMYEGLGEVFKKEKQR